jgi:hypothetical protein
MEVYEVVIILLCSGGFGLQCWYAGRRNGIAGAVEYYTNDPNQDQGEP